MAVGAQTSFVNKRHRPVGRAANAVPSAQKALSPVAIARLQDAVARHQAGDLDGAADLYQAVLKERPNQPDALHLFGVIHHQRGDSQAGVRFIRKALKFDPSNVKALINLGAALTAVGNFDEAARALEEAAGKLPDSAEAHGNLAAVRENQGRSKEAAEHYRAAAERNPANPKYARRWAEMAFAAEDWAGAVTAFGRYLAMVPDDSAARNDMGLAQQKAQRSDDAIASLEQSLSELPDNAMIHANLANALAQTGRLEAAERHFRRSAQLAPDDWKMQINLANFLWETARIDEANRLAEVIIAGRPDDAILIEKIATRMTSVRHYARAEELLHHALKGNPDLAVLHNALGNIHALRFEYAAAVTHYTRATELDPNHLLAHLNLCMTLLKMHRFDEAAIRTYGLRMQPDYGKYESATLSRIIQILKIVADFDGIDSLGDYWPPLETAALEHQTPALLTMMALAEDDEHVERMVRSVRRIGADLEARVAWKANATPHVTKRHDRIRIGLVSADFRNHSAARCILPLLQNYDRNRFDIRCYSVVSTAQDKIQKQIASLADDFIEIDAMDDPTASDRIRSDEMDILFDLSGWTAHSRLPLFAYKPAPHQISWLGWPFTAGLASIEHFLVDRFNAPAHEGLLIEKPLAIDGAWVCFEGSTLVPIGESPFKRNGHITFGTLNNTYKISPKQVGLWARIMAAVPGSRFLLARAEARSLMFCRNLMVEFAKYGIGEDRLELIGQNPGVTHFEFYNHFDISLDTYPVVGGVTTMDSLLMGVPVVAMYGSAFHQRIGHSILNHCGLGEFSVPTPEAFVETACRLAADTDRLAEMRAELRAQVLASPLFDGPGFAKHFGAAMMRLVGAPN
jgi:predicted O-linked N-acetylglucosamine transferase (SPINDLY family)